MSSLTSFERLVRNLHRVSDEEERSEIQHPFDIRNIHNCLPVVVRQLFDNAHYSQATFEAFKYLDNEIKRHSGLAKTGKSLMMEAFKEEHPRIKNTGLLTES